MNARIAGAAKREIGAWGGKKVALSDGERLIKQSVSGYRTAGWLWWHGPLALTGTRLIWTPGFFDRLFVGPVVIPLSEIVDVRRHSMSPFDWLLGGGPHWLVSTDRRSFMFAFGGRMMNNDDPDVWIEPIREWLANS